MSSLDSPLAPGYLVAAPNLKDPNFAQTIVLMAEHGSDGAIGFIVNKSTSITLETLLNSVDSELAIAAKEAGIGDQEILVGGPVQNNIAWILYHKDGSELDEGSIAVGDELVLGASMDTLRSLVLDERKSPFIVFLGYSGWGVKQLEDEIGVGSWIPLEMSHDLTFDVPIDDRWDDAVKRLGLVPGGFIMGGPGASA